MHKLNRRKLIKAVNKHVIHKRTQKTGRQTDGQADGRTVKPTRPIILINCGNSIVEVQFRYNDVLQTDKRHRCHVSNDKCRRQLRFPSIQEATLRTYHWYEKLNLLRNDNWWLLVLLPWDINMALSWNGIIVCSCFLRDLFRLWMGVKWIDKMFRPSEFLVFWGKNNFSRILRINFLFGFLLGRYNFKIDFNCLFQWNLIKTIEHI